MKDATVKGCESEAFKYLQTRSVFMRLKMGDQKYREYSEMLDRVSAPSHYNREGAMECIDEMRLVFGDEAVIHFCLLNAWKYRYRAADKNGEEDLLKSDWYLRKYKEIKYKEIKKCMETNIREPL